MKTVRLTNKGDVDVMVDTQGLDRPEHKVIIHPKATQTLSVANSQIASIRSNRNLICSNL